MRATSILSLAAACGFAAPSGAQVREGDVLLNQWFHGRLDHYRTDGTLLAQATHGAAANWVGAGIDSDGRWVTVKHGGGSELFVFDPDGTLLQKTPIPEVGFVAGDVSLFADGTIAICDLAEVELYSPLGVHLQTISAPGMGRLRGSLIDPNDELWVCDGDADAIWHFDRDGTLLGSIVVPVQFPALIGDVDMAPDGTLWTVLMETGEARHYSTDGTLLGSFDTSLGPDAAGIAVAPNGTLWMATASSNQVRNYDTAGNQVGGFDVLFAVPFYLTVPKGLGIHYCSPALAHSGGFAGRISASGSDVVARNDLSLTALDLPAGEFGYFLVGSSQGRFQPPGSEGVICIAGGALGRFVQAGQIILGPMGSIMVDLGALPTSPPTAVQPGGTWNFQAWFRDLGSSNFTDAVSITFR